MSKPQMNADRTNAGRRGRSLCLPALRVVLDLPEAGRSPRTRRLPAPRVSRAKWGKMRTAAAILMVGLLASPAAPKPSGVRPDGDVGRRGDSESTGTPTLPRQRGGNPKAVYFCPHKGQLSATDLAAHPGIVVATKFDQVKAAASKLIAIWIDKDAIRDVDLEWLHKPPQKYYPIVVVGYRSALYSFREALGGFDIQGPFVEWEKVKLSPGFSVWMLTSKTIAGTSSIMRGYDVAPTVAGILEVTTPLLEESIASETVPWGRVSNGLQCRLSPATQTVTVAQGAKPHDIEVHASYDLRNASDAALQFSPTGTPLWGQSLFEVTGPDGRKVRYIGVKSEVRPPVPPVALATGETLRRRVKLEYDFTHPGKYLVSTRKESAQDGPEVMAYYGGDRKKALANPDRVWTGSLLSNTVTVAITREAVGPAAQPGADRVPWGEPSDGLQCRLTPAVQELVVQPDDDPTKRAVELVFQMRNVGDRAIRVDPMNGPLAHWRGGLVWVDPSGKTRHWALHLPEGDPPRAGRSVTILPGQTVVSRVVATDCFHRHGTYQVSFSDRGSSWRALNPGPKTTLTSNTVRVRIVPARDMPWGEPAEGVQVRLRTERAAWPFNETPAFNVDMRNEGRRRLAVYRTMEFFRFEVDGQWYDWPRKVGAHERPSPFGPDRRHDDLSVKLWGSWEAARDGRQLLRLRAGKHTVRIAFTAGPAEDD
ncbi:MAG: hypothetical protein ACYTAS_20600, partial [Planctomycetota bacterium]